MLGHGFCLTTSDKSWDALHHVAHAAVEALAVRYVRPAERRRVQRRVRHAADLQRCVHIQILVERRHHACTGVDSNRLQ